MALAHTFVVLAQHGDDHVAARGLLHRFVDAGPLGGREGPRGKL